MNNENKFPFLDPIRTAFLREIQNKAKNMENPCVRPYHAPIKDNGRSEPIEPINFIWSKKNHVQDVIFLCHERIKASAFLRGVNIIIASNMSELAMKTFQDSMHRYTLMSPLDVWMVIIVSKKIHPKSFPCVPSWNKKLSITPQQLSK